MTRDPAVATTRSPYGYVASNPLNDTDPSGLCGVFDPLGCVSDVVGGAVNVVSSTATYAWDHPAVVAGVAGLAAATVATGGTALALGGVAIAATGVQTHRDATKAGDPDVGGLVLDAASLILGMGAEIARLKAESRFGQVVGRAPELYSSGLSLAEGAASAERVAVAGNSALRMFTWGGRLAWTSAGIGALGVSTICCRPPTLRLPERAADVGLSSEHESDDS